MLLGIICGIGTNFQYLSFNLGEIIYILIGLFLIIKNKKIYYDKNLKILVGSMSIFVVYMMLYYTLPVISKGNITKQMIKYIEILIIIIVTYQFLKYDKKKFIRFLLFYFISCFFIKSLDYGSFYSVRYIHMSTYMLIFCTLLQYEFFYKRKILLLLIALFLAVYGRSRTSLVILLMASIYYFYQKLIEKNITKKQLVEKTVIILMVLVVSFIGIQYLSDQLEMETASNIERKELISTSINIIKDNFIFGIGPGNFAQYAIEEEGLNIETNKTVHNYFLEILVEFGAVGFILIILPYLFIIVSLVKKETKNNKMKWYSIYLIIFYLFNVMSGEVRVEYGILLGISLFQIKNEKVEEQYFENSNDSLKLQ